MTCEKCGGRGCYDVSIADEMTPEERAGWEKAELLWHTPSGEHLIVCPVCKGGGNVPDSTRSPE